MKNPGYINIRKKNALYQKFETLKTNRNKRHKCREFIVEGVRNINAAIDKGWRVVSFIYNGDIGLSTWATGCINEASNSVNYALSESLMQDLSEKGDTSEIMAVVSMDSPHSNPISDSPLTVLFDRPANKGNLGAILRSCDAFGADKLFITGHSVDIYDPEVISASTGSFFNVPFERLSENREIDLLLAGLKESCEGLKIIGTDEKGTKPLFKADLKPPLLIMLGNEKDGLNRYLLSKCDDILYIPMAGHSGASSLNVSCAASIVLYEAMRQSK